MSAGAPPLFPGGSVNPIERVKFTIDALMQATTTLRLRSLDGEAHGYWRLCKKPRGDGYRDEDLRVLAELPTTLNHFEPLEQTALQRQGWVTADDTLQSLGEHHQSPPDDLGRTPSLAQTLRACRG